jgi:hypothetical protein
MRVNVLGKKTFKMWIKSGASDSKIKRIINVCGRRFSETILMSLLVILILVISIFDRRKSKFPGRDLKKQQESK